jgi:hypothetical protein
MPDERYSDSIILLLSRRASIARLTNEAIKLAWTALFNMIAFLIRPGCTELVSGNERGTGKRVLAPGQSILTVPPLSLSIVCPYCQEVREFLHNLAPRQIEVAAKYVGITNKVHGFDCNRSSRYDDFWRKRDTSMKRR